MRNLLGGMTILFTAGSAWSLINERDGRLWLYGGDAPGQAFDITAFRLDPKRLNFGLGREAFHALIEPAFGQADDPKVTATASTRIVAVVINGEVKAYPIQLLRRHEVINDTVGGRAVFVAHCPLADLTGVYDRTMNGHTYTFAVSGYTYADQEVWDGRNAFVLWDRDTESLWWPPVGQGVSGAMIDVPLQLTPRRWWAHMTWGAFMRRYPSGMTLKAGQRLSRPPNIEAYTGPYPSRTPVTQDQSVPPQGAP